MIYDSLIAGMWRLVRRRWYLFATLVALGVLAATVLSSNSAHTVEQSIQIGELEAAGALLDAGDVPEVNVSRLAQQAQLDFDQSALDDEIEASYSSNTTARAVTVRIAGDTSDEVNEALLELNARFVEITSGPIRSQIDAGIDNADATINSLEAAAADVQAEIAAQDLDQVTLSVLISELSSMRSDVSDARERRGALVGLRNYVEGGFLVFGGSSISEPARGKIVYVAGAMGGITIAALVAAVMVLTDRRVRRVAHLQRAAPGATVLGVVANSSSALDTSLRSAIRTFVSDHQLVSLTVFGIDSSRDIEELGRSIEGDLPVPVNISSSQSAESLDVGSDAKVGYVAVARWGGTTEDQVSAAVGDIERAGSFPIGLVLTGIPARDRDWIVASPRVMADI